MASDSGPVSVQADSSSGRSLQGRSKCQDRPEHEVFLSYNREQEAFVHDLFQKFLKHPRFQYNEPFYDARPRSLQTGEEWRHRLMKAARNCKVAVMILTKNFVNSPWPMLELLHFTDARKKDNPDMKLIPVFFGDLSPDLLDDKFIEDQWKVIQEKIDKEPLGSKLGEISLTLESYKAALLIVKNTNGMMGLFNDLKSFDRLEDDIVNKVLAYLPSGFDPELDSDVVGCRRLCETLKGAFQEYDGGRRCLGLYGVGGSGKTTICRALCSYFGPSFNHRAYYLKIESNGSNLKEKSLVERDKELLRNLSNKTEDEINRIVDLQKTLRNYLREKPVFLAVDINGRGDLKSSEEVRNYMKYLGPGSMVIIAARSRDILKCVRKDIHCERVPNLNEEEALSLFFKIAGVPERKLTELDLEEMIILQQCLKICSFVPEGAAAGMRTEDSHFHPLALRATAFSFGKHYCPHQDNIAQCGKDLLIKGELLFASQDASDEIFAVLGIGFHDIEPEAMQLFIDIALYAPRPDGGKDIFKWLVRINNRSSEIILMKLDLLRMMGCLDYEDGAPGHSACRNIRMHDLYREYAKKLVNKLEDSYKYGVYFDHYFPASSLLASSGWTKAPRIRLESRKDVIKVEEWARTVTVIHLVQCDTITTFLIGQQLVDVRELKICYCSKLKKLDWTPQVISEQLVGGFKLCFVNIKYNESLDTLPDFSGCSELRNLSIKECSSSVMPITLHDCLRLKTLYIAGKDVPEVQSLQSCPKLRSVQLAWKASHKSLIVKSLPSLLKLTIAGSSVLPSDHSSLEDFVPHGRKLFRRQYPDDKVRYEVVGISELTTLRELYLNYIPFGCLPLDMGKLGSGLNHLSLRGCLLSDRVDISEFRNLKYLSVAQTNVKELYARGLKELVYLDCRFNFRLEKVPDLRPFTRLELVSLTQCPELRAIPRLPPGCYAGSRESEDAARMKLAVEAFTKTSNSDIPTPLFALISDRIPPSTSGSKNFDTKVNIKFPQCAIPHLEVMCDGCLMFPLLGTRYEVKGVRTRYDLCPKCFTNKCPGINCSFTENSSSQRHNFTVEKNLNYDLCHACFKEADCEDSDFYDIDDTPIKFRA